MSPRHNDHRWRNQHDQTSLEARAKLELQSKRIRYNLHRYQLGKGLKRRGFWYRLKSMFR